MAQNSILTKGELCKKFEKNILGNKLEKSVKYGIILHHNFQNDFWNKIIELMAKHINVRNILLPIYIFNKHNQSINEVDISLQEMRNIVVDVICVICLSERAKIVGIPKIGKDYLEINNIRKKIITKNFDISKKYFNIDSNDISSFIKIGLNEIAFLIYYGGNTVDIIYWIEWLKKQKIDCNTYKNISGISEKLCNDWVWLVWDMIFDKNDNHIIKCLYKLYKVNYKKGERNKRFFIIYFALLLLDNRNNPNCNRCLINEESYHLCVQMSCKINYLYNSVKKYFILHNSNNNLNNSNSNNNLENNSKNLKDGKKKLEDESIFKYVNNNDDRNFMSFIEKNDEEFKEKKKEKKKSKKISKKNSKNNDVINGNKNNNVIGENDVIGGNGGSNVGNNGSNVNNDKKVKKKSKGDIEKEEHLKKLDDYKTRFDMIDNLLFM